MDNPNVSSDNHNSATSVTEELIAAAIAGIVSRAWAQGQSLNELKNLVLEDDLDLDRDTRQWLSEIVAEAWRDLSASATIKVD
jgi:hypothetical protein